MNRIDRALTRLEPLAAFIERAAASSYRVALRAWPYARPIGAALGSLAAFVGVFVLDQPVFLSGGSFPSLAAPLVMYLILLTPPAPRSLMGASLWASVLGSLLIAIPCGPFWPLVLLASAAWLGPVIIVSGVTMHLMDAGMLPQWPPVDP